MTTTRPSTPGPGAAGLLGASVPDRAEAFPSAPAASLPAVTAAEMARVDQLAVDAFGISILQMMEQAGSHLAEVVASELGGQLRGRRILVAAGPGNNGGGGLATARHLANRGARVRVVLARPARRLSEASRHQLATLLEMGVSCCMAVYDISDPEMAAEVEAAELVIDAVLGYRGSGALHGEVAALVERIAGAADRTLSLDLPSGMDADTGEAAGVAVSSRATLTLALPKRGLLTQAGRSRSGRLYLADIGLPTALYARMDISLDAPFSAGRIVRLLVEP